MVLSSGGRNLIFIIENTLFDNTVINNGIIIISQGGFCQGEYIKSVHLCQTTKASSCQSTKKTRPAEMIFAIPQALFIVFQDVTFSYSNKFCIFRKLITSVDVLCNSAETSGRRIPPAPSKIRPVLNPTMI